VTAPPPFPRTPYLWLPGDKSPSDEWVARAEILEWLSQPIVAEEKLDGANVSLWLEDDLIRTSSRGGVNAMDRGRQLGRLRAWAAEKNESLRAILKNGWVLYGEWLWVTHGTRYDLLPDWLIVLDLWHPAWSFAPIDIRDQRATGHGLHVPPRLFEGSVSSGLELTRLFGRSAFSTTARREGLFLRRSDGARCKVVDPTYKQVTDIQWQRRQHNSLAPTGA
jgi:hypothetical protein